MTQKITHLRPEDEISREQYLAEIQNYTNQDAQELGYPNIEVFHLAHHLSSIAGEWRRTKAKKQVHDYRNTLYEMILKGYDLDGLPIEDQLPEDLMPELPPPSVRTAILEAYEKVRSASYG